MNVSFSRSHTLPQAPLDLHGASGGTDPREFETSRNLYPLFSSSPSVSTSTSPLAVASAAPFTSLSQLQRSACTSRSARQAMLKVTVARIGRTISESLDLAAVSQAVRMDELAGVAFSGRACDPPSCSSRAPWPRCLKPFCIYLRR